MPYYIGDLNRDPTLENYPGGKKEVFVGFRGSLGLSGVISVSGSRRLTGL